MRNISRLNQALQLLNGGGSPRQIQSALDKIEIGKSQLPVGTRVREENNRQLLQDRLADERIMDELEDPWSGSYVMREPDAFEEMAEQALMSSVGAPSFNRKVTLETPANELTPRELKAQQATRNIINNKLAQPGLGAMAASSTAAVINNSQGDDQDANIITNPVTGTIVGTALAGGAGGLTGFYMNNTPSREMAVEMSKDRKRGSGSGYERDAAFEKNYSKKYDRQVRQRGIRGGLKGASIVAGGITLLQLLDAMNNEGSEVMD